ncbi:hypothetical protein [Deinococcus hopiensis]|uniref:Uncharacterized protein n=1 Tax=Deinococcus hopiensis KR-140 TaxID=695939 RepID=A0A1W1VIM7_9DEIO|nr:hypothetical protein [Deinococcus hopiensis]SMB93133.1 hypothetical protein SAMN00790413_01860 [Deinococcus hopiensis KR-140]
MKLIQVSDVGVELEMNGEALRAARRVDRYVKPGKWLRPSEYVEIWRLEDGREVRVSRVHGTSEWKARWRSAS